eukprot:1212795-Rhodomonas_salina.2
MSKRESHSMIKPDTANAANAVNAVPARRKKEKRKIVELQRETLPASLDENATRNEMVSCRHRWKQSHHKWKQCVRKRKLTSASSSSSPDSSEASLAS